MHKLCWVLLFGVLCCVRSWAADEFDTINCGADVPKAMVGKHSPNERVVVTEARHHNLGLKDLGGIEISDQLFLISWSICGREYAELLNIKENVVRDVLPVPTHSLYSPESLIEQCQVAGKKIPDAVIAILDNRQALKPHLYLESIILPAKMAWKIDEGRQQFVPMPTERLSCAISGSSEDVKQ